MGGGKGDRYTGFSGGDDGLDSDEDLEEQLEDAGTDQNDRDDRDEAQEIEVTSPSSESQESTDSRTEESQPTDRDEFPHRIRYDSPKDGRDYAKTLVFTGEDKKRLSELETLADEEFDEEVYRLDVYLAALRAGIRSSEEAFLEEMRRIGYGYWDES